MSALSPPGWSPGVRASSRCSPRHGRGEGPLRQPPGARDQPQRAVAPPLQCAAMDPHAHSRTA
eukprot:16433529-Heterocapsa_arctica.AAC.1